MQASGLPPRACSSSTDPAGHQGHGSCRSRCRSRRSTIVWVHHSPSWNDEPVAPDAWEESGLYQPDAPGAGERRALLEYLTGRGATVEQMVEAHRLGSLPALAGDLVMGTPPPTVS